MFRRLTARFIWLLPVAFVILALPFESINAQTVWQETRPPVPAEGLKVGNELLTWGNEHGLRVLTYDGQVVARSQYVGRTYAAFAVLDRWVSSQTSAVLLQADLAATKDCASIYVIETRRPASVVSHALGQVCVGMDERALERNQEGFIFTESPTPIAPGRARQWRARTGDVATSEIEFRPVVGSTMIDLVSKERFTRTDPLLNAEFFQAVSRLSKLEQGRLLTALWQVDNGCGGCGGSAQKELYGVVIDDRTAAYSGCGWWMNGGVLLCGASDALAIWDRRSGSFYFATDTHREDGVHDVSAALTVWPALEGWAPVARDRFERWRNGRPWRE